MSELSVESEYDFDVGSQATPSRRTSALSEDLTTEAQQVWQPDLSAPEFIPTLTRACPVVGVCCIVPEEEAQLEAGFQLVEAGFTSVPAASYIPAPTASIAQVPAPASAKASRRHPRGYRPAPLQEMAAAETASAIPQDSCALPKATEEEWQHRKTQRQRSIASMKATREYQWHASRRSVGVREDGEPLTPNPFDRSVSKRHWKYVLQQWRDALNVQFLEEGLGSVASVDDCRWSVGTATTMTGDATAFDGDDASSSAACERHVPAL